MLVEKKSRAGVLLALDALEASCSALRILLSESNEESEPAPWVAPLWLTINEASEVFRVARTTLRRAARDCQISAARVDRKLVLRRDSVAAYVDASTIHAAPSSSAGSANADELDLALAKARGRT